MRAFGCGRGRRPRRKRRGDSPQTPRSGRAARTPARGNGTLQAPETPTRGDAGTDCASERYQTNQRKAGARRLDPPWPARRATPRRTGEPASAARRETGRRPGCSTKWGLAAMPAPIFRLGTADRAADAGELLQPLHVIPAKAGTQSGGGAGSRPSPG